MAKLILVPTPIGNLEDITLRAIRVLKEADLILAEDTRKSGILLKHFGIGTPMMSHHKFNEHRAVEGIVQRIANGQTLALITDAGTPGISDPGFLLVRQCVEAGIEVETLPGAVAFIPALVNSGLPSDRFYFEGFLPQKKGRQTRLEWLKTMPFTWVMYESPFRLTKTLLQLAEKLGDERKAAVSRELTKIHEENRRGTLKELADHYTAHPPKGEIVITVEGAVDEDREMFVYAYPRPAVTVDIVVLKEGELLLIRRGREPFKGQWALPGGFIEMDEELEDAARRELFEETGLKNVTLRQVGAYGGVNRDPRHRTIAVAFVARVKEGEPAAGDDADEVKWFPANELPELAFDHSRIIRDALELF